jgi:hypothetical protein
MVTDENTKELLDRRKNYNAEVMYKNEWAPN